MTKSSLPAPSMSPKEFADEMRPLAAALSDWAGAWSAQVEHHGFLPSAGSRAIAELAAERAWSTPDWFEPARNSHSYGHMLCYALSEHLAALAAIIEHSVLGPVFAYKPSVRAIFEAVPLAHWLLDPTITVETRIKRSITYRLKSASQVGGLTGLPSAVTESLAAQAACKAFADHHGWPILSNAVGGEALPNAKDDYSAVALGKRNPLLDGSVWSVVSATQHSVWFSLVASLSDGITATDPLDPYGGVAPIVVKGTDIATYAAMCWQGCRVVAEAREALMGWTPMPGMAESAVQIARERRRLSGDLATATRSTTATSPATTARGV